MINKKPVNPILRTTTKIVSWFIFLFGLYIAANSSNTTAGGSAGGVLIALSAILIIAAFGKSFIDIFHTRGFISVLTFITAFFIGMALLFSGLASQNIETIHGFNFSVISEVTFKMGVALGLFAILLAMLLSDSLRKKE